MIKKKLFYYLKELLILLIVVAFFSNMISLYRSFSLNQNSLQNVSSQLINTKKEIKIIHFWATWCPVCKLEAPNIEYISKDYDLLTVAVKSKDSDIKQYMKENQLSFKVIDDSNGLLAKDFNVSVYPTTFIYDKNGKLIFSEVGYTTRYSMIFKIWLAKLRLF